MLLQSENQDLRLFVGHLMGGAWEGLGGVGEWGKKKNDGEAGPGSGLSSGVAVFTLNMWRMREPRSLRLSTTLKLLM